MDRFDFGIDKQNIPLMTLTANGLSFNGRCLEVLGFPSFVNIGIDRENKRLAVKAKSDGSLDHPTYRFVTDETKKKRVCITASQIRAEIERLTDVRVQRGGIQFFAAYDAASGMLVVDLNISV